MSELVLFLIIIYCLVSFGYMEYLIPVIIISVILYAFWNLMGRPKSIKIKTNKFSKKQIEDANAEYCEHKKRGRFS